MDPQTTTLQESEFVLRRLAEPMEWPALLWPVLFAFAVLLFIVGMRQGKKAAFLGIGALALLTISGIYLALGYALVSTLSWWLVLVPTLAVGMVYVGLMYVRDAHSISVAWAGFLALLRLCVYALLALCFLLPARQNYEVTVTESKVLLLFDVSGSIDATDTAASKSRMEHVVDFLGKPYSHGKDGKPRTFMEHLQEIAPVTCYRFGGIADYEPAEFSGGPKWTSEKAETQAGRKWSENRWRDWLEMKVDRNNDPTPLTDPLFKKGKNPDSLSAEEKFDLEKRRMTFENHVKALKNSTDIGGSIKQVLEREAGSRIQAVIVFSDGKSNVPDAAALDEVIKASGDKSKPFHIITVGVGDYKLPRELDVAPLIVPADRRVDDIDLMVGVPFSAKGLGDKEFEVFLYARRVKDDKHKELPGAQPVLVGYDKGKFGGGPAPSHQSDVKILIANLQPDVLKANAKKILDRAAKAGTKDKVKEEDQTPTALDDAKKKDVLGEWEFVAEVRVLGDDSVRSRRGHYTNIDKVLINESALRVLLFSSGPSRDYQFVKGVFLREVQKKRAKLSIFLQTAKEDYTSVTEDSEGVLWLPDFPNRLDRPKKGAKGDAAKSGKEGDPMNLKSYDVIIAFDADWESLVPSGVGGGKENQLELLKEWVSGEHRGGLVFVSGPQYTARLIPPPDPEKRKNWVLKPVFDLMPVVLKRPASALKAETLHDSTIPYQLNFTEQARAFDFLQLNPKGNSPTAGWEEYFGPMVKDEKVHPTRGFFTYYRVDDVKDLSVVLATFLDPRAPKTAKGKDQPYFVLLPYGTAGKTFYIGSGEMWRLRTYKEEFHQLFWQNLTRYLSARTSGKSFGTFQMQRDFEPGPIAIEAEVRDKDGMPLDPKIYKDLKVQLKRVDAGATDKDEPQYIALKPKHTTGKPDGRFVTIAEVRGEGRYEARINIPDTNEFIKKTFTVQKKGAELADLGTDFLKLQLLASEPTSEMRQRLQDSMNKAREGGSSWSSVRLFFPLNQAWLATECLSRTPAITETRKGERKDIWNLGPMVYEIDNWEDAPTLYTLILAIPAVLLLATAAIMLTGKRWISAAGLLIALLAVEGGLGVVTYFFTPRELFNPSVLGVLLVVPTIIALLAAGILLLAERYIWSIGIIGGLALYLLGFALFNFMVGMDALTEPSWFRDGLPVDFVWLLLLIGLLLSLEWFTRKMLRLA